MKIYIYKIFFPVSNKCYIGQTSNLERRLFEHLNSKHLISYALNKYDDWQIEVLHICSLKEEANKLEIEEIKNHNSKFPNGYNQTNGGDGGNTWEGRHHTEEWKKNQSKRRKGKILSKEHKNKIAEVQRNRIYTEEDKRKMARYGNQNAKGNKLSKISQIKRLITRYKNKINKLEQELID